MRIVAVIVLQAGTLLGLAGYHESVRAQAPTFRIPLQPYDPHDVLRGRYFRLNPLDARITLDAPEARLKAEKATLPGRTPFVGDALVGFCPDGEHHRVCALRLLSEPASGPPAAFWSRARVEVWGATPRSDAPPHRVTVDFGLDRFFIPNRATLPGLERDPGWELEVSYRPGQRLLPRRLFFRGQPVAFD